jgi:hypothetical protein
MVPLGTSPLWYYSAIPNSVVLRYHWLNVELHRSDFVDPVAHLPAYGLFPRLLEIDVNPLVFPPLPNSLLHFHRSFVSVLMARCARIV